MGLVYRKRARESYRECSETRLRNEDTLRVSKDGLCPFSGDVAGLLAKGWNKEARFHSCNHMTGTGRLRVNEAFIRACRVTGYSSSRADTS